MAFNRQEAFKRNIQHSKYRVKILEGLGKTQEASKLKRQIDEKVRVNEVRKNK